MLPLELWHVVPLMYQDHYVDIGRPPTWRTPSVALLAAPRALLLQWTSDLRNGCMAGINDSLRRQGVQEGDSVRIGDTEMEWSDDQSEQHLYGAWMAERKASGRASQGSARWPHKGR